MQLYQNATNSVENQHIIAETAVVLELLAFAMTIIALPGTPPALGKVFAIMAHNCAINWAAMLHDEAAAVEGGAQ
jgi:hypothetical protein